MSFARAGRGHSKPGHGAQINWTHPLTQGLIACIPFTERSGLPQDLCNMSRAFVALTTSPPIWLADRFYYNGNTQQIKMTLNQPPNGPYTVAFAFSDTGFSSNTIGPSLGSAGATDKYVHFKTTSTTSFSWGQFGDDGSYTVPDMSKRRCVAVCTMDRAKIQKLYFDGKYISQRTATGLFSGDATLAWPGITGTVATGIAAVEFIYVWNRELSPTEASWIYQEPYSFLVSGSLRRYPGSGVLSPFTPSTDFFEQLIVQ